ncbi:DUF6348 family protein [Lysobacter sp. CFH 32150]|uniref:DUF6348 family protein n=1 Tax=Lysobacter sp. CFH 32150 TaxID=2927128 RepID=UPI001FA7520D|nr:DUF6348 family protein [Lysobacter sp. CFH 32150]MCI4569484.1 DUF6348 family protein [Lysobacter sp. CFH 32150]
MEQIESLLENALLAHGIQSVCADGSFLIPGDLRLTPLVHEMSTVPDHRTISLEILAESPRLNGGIISECFAGIASTTAEAINQAFGKFLLGTFHVLLEALSDHRCKECQAEIEHWASPSGHWTVYSGPLLSQHSSKSVLTHTYSAVLQQLQQQFERIQLSSPHWVRVFVASYHGKIQATEAVLDNEPWPEALDVINHQSWQPSDEYQAIRHFFLALPAKG